MSKHFLLQSWTDLNMVIRIKNTGHVIFLTCKKLLSDFECVYQRGEDTLNGAKHAAEAEVNQH